MIQFRKQTASLVFLLKLYFFHSESCIGKRILKITAKQIFTKNQDYTVLSFAPNRYCAFQPNLIILIIGISGACNRPHVVCQYCKNLIGKSGNVFNFHLFECETIHTILLRKSRFASGSFGSMLLRAAFRRPQMRLRVAAIIFHETAARRRSRAGRSPDTPMRSAFPSDRRAFSAKRSAPSAVRFCRS